VCRAGSGLRDELITGIEEFYHVCMGMCVCVCVCNFVLTTISKTKVSITVAVSITQYTCFFLHNASPLSCSSLHQPKPMTLMCVCGVCVVCMCVVCVYVCVCAVCLCGVYVCV